MVQRHAIGVKPAASAAEQGTCGIGRRSRFAKWCAAADTRSATAAVRDEREDHAIADLEVFYIGSQLDDLAGGFVAEHHGHWTGT
jgi:hypothetical protein